MVAGVPPGDGVIVVLVQQHPLLVAALVRPHEDEAAGQLLAVQVEVGSPSSTACNGSSWPSLAELQVPQSHTMTSPPPYSPLGITPSKSK